MIGASGARPVAASTKLSLVDVSPSTVAPLNDTSATSRTICASSGAAIGASVAMNDSIVAMSGWIMPAPFAMPVTVTGTPSTVTRRDAPFGTVSVVMIAFAAANQPSARAAALAAGSASTMRLTGSGSMITPVEYGSTSSGAQSSSRATATHSACASASPDSPVPAFALPALTMSARIPAPAACCRARCSRQTITGAAQKRLRVNTPAATVPGSQTTSRTSLRSQFLILPGGGAERDAGNGQQRIGVGGYSEQAWSNLKAGRVHDARICMAVDHGRRPAARRRPSDFAVHPMQKAQLRHHVIPRRRGRLLHRLARICRGSACTSCRCRTGTDRCGRPCRPRA